MPNKKLRGWSPFLYLLAALIVIYLGLSYWALNGQILYESTTFSPSRAASIEQGIDITDPLQVEVESDLPDTIILDVWIDRRRTHRMFGLFGTSLGYVYYDGYCTVNIANISGTDRLLIRADEMTHSGSKPLLHALGGHQAFIRERDKEQAVIEVYKNIAFGAGKLDTLGRLTVRWKDRRAS